MLSKRLHPDKIIKNVLTSIYGEATIYLLLHLNWHSHCHLMFYLLQANNGHVTVHYYSNGDLCMAYHYVVVEHVPVCNRRRLSSTDTWRKSEETRWDRWDQRHVGARFVQIKNDKQTWKQNPPDHLHMRKAAGAWWWLNDGLESFVITR